MGVRTSDSRQLVLSRWKSSKEMRVRAGKVERGDASLGV
jgi:hypothetical protein